MSNPNPEVLNAAFEQITSGLERILAGISTLKLHIVATPEGETLDFDPRDPANKYEIGGLEKLTDRGVEICYRLFDAGKTRYAVANLMNISFGAATHRFHAWEKAGGINRERIALD